MKDFISKLIYQSGEYLYNSRIKSAYEELRSSEYASDAELDRLQEKKLSKLLEHAVQTTKYYKERYKGININEVSLQNIKDLPILTKKELFENSDNMFSTAFHRNNLIKSETSGSTGDAFIFFRDYEWDAYHRAAIARGLLEHGIKPYSRNIYLWGFIATFWEKLKIKFFDALQNRYRLFTYNEQEIVNLLKSKQDVEFISGYSSVINHIALVALKHNLKLNALKAVKGTSEKIYPDYIKNVEKAFNVPFISEYGAAETGIIAYSCKHGVQHTIRENVIVESVNNRAIITNLNSYSMPIIRYDLGDYIELTSTQCKCGRHSQTIDEILGRVGKDICGKTKKFPSLTLYYIFKELALKNNLELSYSALQKKVGLIEISIFKNIDEDEMHTLRKVCNKYFKNDLDLKIIIGSIINKDKKMKDFTSEL